jgi:hypothetical protein
MIIYEGFIENAKKIAETNPQNSEVRVPIIKRENFEYHVDIKYGPEKEKGIYRKFKKCIIFKETGNVYTSDNGLSFDADLFITPDSVYEFICMIYNIDMDSCMITEDNGRNIFEYDRNTAIDKTNGMLVFGNLMSISHIFDRLKSIRNDFMEFGISDTVFHRWLRRNDTEGIDISGLMPEGQKGYVLYPVRIRSNDTITELLSGCRMKKICLELDLLDNYVSSVENKNITDALCRSGINEFICMYGRRNITIVPLFPFLYGGRYIYAQFTVFKNSNSKSDIFKYLYDLMHHMYCYGEYVKMGERTYSVPLESLRFVDMPDKIKKSGNEYDYR